MKVNTAEVDRYVTPLSRKTISIDTDARTSDSQHRGKDFDCDCADATSTRIDTPGVRIATVSKLKFAEATTGTRLSVD